MPNPQIDPALYEQMMQEGGQPQPGAEPQPGMPPQGGEPQPGATPPQGGQPQPGMQPPAANPEAEIEEAKKLLGLDGYESKIAEMQNQLEAIESQRVQAAMASKYPDVPQDAVEEKIKQIEQVNPELAKTMRVTEAGLEMAYKAAMADILPREKPDKLTDEGGGGGGGESNLEDLVKEGKADDFALGNFILGAS